MPGGLAERHCVPCKGGVPPLDRAHVQELLDQLDGWQVVGGHHLSKVWRFRNYAEALAFTNRLSEVAEAEKHHPDVHLSWGEVRLDIYTHKIDGLTESDFVLAAKIDACGP